MQIRLISLVLACGVLILSIGSCGGDASDFKPPNKTGALDSGAPDVILFLTSFEDQEILEATVASKQDWLAGGLIRFDAAYVRTPNSSLAAVDLFSLGKTKARSSGGESITDSALFSQMRQGGYSTKVLGARELQGYLKEPNSSPRFVLVESTSIQDWTSNAQVWTAPDQFSERGILTVITALPAAKTAGGLSESALHVPLLFGVPNSKASSAAHTQVVSLPDVGLTILDLCGLLPEGPRTSDNEAASFARILQKKPLVWRGFVLAISGAGDAWIRSTRWRLVHSEANGLILSYIEEDPTSTKDDSDLAGAKAQLEGLGGRLSAWRK